MPLSITRRAGTGSLTIVGTVAGTRVRRRAQSDGITLAREEAAALEAEILRTEWHGERRGFRSLDEALVSLLALKVEGSWSSTALVERYCHLMPAGHEAAVRRFWGIAVTKEELVA
jgi:hypothetical protein